MANAEISKMTNMRVNQYTIDTCDIDHVMLLSRVVEKLGYVRCQKIRIDCCIECHERLIG